MNRAHARRVYYAQLKRVVPIATVLERYGVLHTLKRRGRQLVGPCPIHGGTRKTQFVVDDRDKQLWRCFSPEHDSGGSILELVAEMEKVDIQQAAERIAQWFAIAAPRPGRTQPERRKVMSGARPAYKVFAVEDKKEEVEDFKPWWTRIGSAWMFKTKDGRQGISIQLQALPINDRIVLTEYDDEDAAEDDKKAAARSKRK